MSVQNALRFIAAVREDAELRSRIEQLGLTVTLDDLVALGAERKFTFTTEEMQQAYRYDWTMRRARYSPPSTPGPSE
jgi:predicted ribosomally synthesized peptide with nif11-like leader